MNKRISGLKKKLIEFNFKFLFFNKQNFCQHTHNFEVLKEINIVINKSKLKFLELYTLNIETKKSFFFNFKVKK